MGSGKWEVKTGTAFPISRFPLPKRLTSALLLLLAASCGPDGLSKEWERVEPPAPAADFSLQALDGSTVSLSSQKGRIVLLEFWATWCGPCRFSTPSLDVIYRKYKDRGVSVLLVNHGEEADVIRKWAKTRFVAPILLDPQKQVTFLYQADALPKLFVIDQQGRIVYVHEGYGGGLEASLKLILDEMLAPPGDAPVKAAGT